MPGKLIGVGVGPGDVELLTLRAIRLIQSAPVLAYTINKNGFSYARQTVSAYIRKDQTELALCFSMSPDREIRRQSRNEAAKKVLAAVMEGNDVVFITEGDPLLYSTFQHLLAELQNEVSVEICPGISAMSAAASAACFPLAIEKENVIIAPAEKALGHIHEWLAQRNCLVLYKAAHQIKNLQEEIRSLNFSCETALVLQVSTQDQMLIKELDAWAIEDVPYFSLVLIRPTQPSGSE